MPLKDLSGKRIGKILVLSRNFEKQKETKRRDVYWNCVCDCGNQMVKMGFEINPDGCGHCAEREEIGNTYGFLTIVKYLGIKYRGGDHYDRIFQCRCRCGNLFEQPIERLRCGHTISCGCSIMSYGETKIKEILDENKIKYKQQYTFKDLSGDAALLRFDFAILNENNQVIRLIEFDGPQHSVAMFKNQDFQKTQKYDELKNNYAKRNNIPLVRIPYSEKIKININMIMGNKFVKE